jgi:molybdenum cofactor biosynthesis protein MoaC
VAFRLALRRTFRALDACAMLPGMSTEGPYVFEAIDETLPFIPLAARRVLDALGRKLPLEGWLSLPVEERWRLVRAGTGASVDLAISPVVDRAEPVATTTWPVAEPVATKVPLELAGALGPARPLDDARWRSLTPLDRYALAKYAGRPEKVARAYDEIVGSPSTNPTNPFSHLTSAGDAHMVDVGAKTATARRAVASACVRTTREVIEAMAAGGVAKGDVVAVARVAGLLAAKRVPDLIPLCHPVQTTHAAIDFEPDASRGELRVRATVEAFDRTGVEMEAMVAASVAALTVYDMIKSADRWATIDAVRLETKSGGKSGLVARPHARAAAGPSGGSASGVAPPAPEAFVALRDGAPSLDEAIARVKHPGAGAVCAFLGIVRDHSEGRTVVKLEYEAYPAMAVAEMKRVAGEIASELPGVRLAVVHRTGSLVVGDVAVVCAASAPHRDEAYRACRALIDRVKARVPIWKREHGPDGAWWVGWQDARCEDPAHGHDHGAPRQ